MENFKDWIGRSVTRIDTLTQRLFDKYSATMSPFLFEAGERIAPPGLHFGLAPPTPETDETGPDGAELKGVFLPPIPQPRRMWAGGSIETLRPLRHGALVIRTSTIADIQVKQGSNGSMFLVSIAHDIADGDGAAIRERQDLVFSDPPAQTAAPVGPARKIAAEWQVEASPLLLFRFSAFTFNGHRIHYDRRYVTEVEGYPGLIVHGPLLATLLLDLVRRHAPQAQVRAFEFRALQPIFDLAPFTVCGQPSADGAEVQLWIRSPDGMLAMQARAQLA